MLLIRLDKVKTKDGIAYKVLDIVAEELDTLPEEYHQNQEDYCFKSFDGLVVNSVRAFTIGEIVSVGHMEKFWKIITKCCKNLHRIRERLRATEQGWQGEVNYSYSSKV